MTRIEQIELRSRGKASPSYYDHLAIDDIRYLLARDKLHTAVAKAARELLNEASLRESGGLTGASIWYLYNEDVDNLEAALAALEREEE